MAKLICTDPGCYGIVYPGKTPGVTMTRHGIHNYAQAVEAAKDIGLTWDDLEIEEGIQLPGTPKKVNVPPPIPEPESKPKSKPESEPEAEPEKDQDDVEGNEQVIDATANARALAEKHGVDLTTITGTGNSGRIVFADVRDHVAESRS